MNDPRRLPGIRASVLLRLTGRGVVSHPRRSIIMAIVVALAVTAVVATTGRTVAAQRSVLARLEDPSVRVIRITERGAESSLSPASVARLSSLSSVAWVVGLSPAGPIGRNPALGGMREGSAAVAVGTRRYWGDLLGGSLIERSRGRPPRVGEAVVGDRAVSDLRMADHVGTVDDERAGPVAVVGSFASRAPVVDLGAYVLIRGGEGAESITEIVVLVRSSAEVESLVARLPRLLGAEGSIAIDQASELLALRGVLAAEVAGLDAAVLAASLGTAALLLGAIMYGAVEERRREFGLRRSQGATRSVIATLVLMETVALATAGAVAGGMIGSIIVVLQTSNVPDPALTVAIGALVAIAALAGSLAPAVAAAFRQPLYVLRSE